MKEWRKRGNSFFDLTEDGGFFFVDGIPVTRELFDSIKAESVPVAVERLAEEILDTHWRCEA